MSAITGPMMVKEEQGKLWQEQVFNENEIQVNILQLANLTHFDGPAVRTTSLC